MMSVWEELLVILVPPTVVVDVIAFLREFRDVFMPSSRLLEFFSTMLSSLETLPRMVDICWPRFSYGAPLFTS